MHYILLFELEPHSLYGHVWNLTGGPKLRKWYGAPDQIRQDGIDGEKDDEGLYLYFTI